MLALHRVLQSGAYKVDHLHTVIDADLKRVGLHGVSEKLIDHQAASLGIPLEKLYLKASEGHQNYEQLMNAYFADLENEDFEGVLYGDIFLEDLKSYREKMLQHAGLTGYYPLWGEPTNKLIEEFIDAGYKTKVCAANAEFFKDEDLGKTIDRKFIEALTEKVDVCGENGEFHTFVYDGPMFSYPLSVDVKEVVSKEYSYNKKNDDGSIENIKSTFLFGELDF
ncbi:diphthine--ammonia ligase [Fulvivirga sp. RKSG066]|nr:diphthine--ammonia ligase [Fulvivirga aurantia]